MIRVPNAFVFPVKLSDRVFCLQHLDSVIEVLLYGADCPPPDDAS